MMADNPRRNDLAVILPIGISDISCNNHNHGELYQDNFPIKSVYHALAIYRDGSPVGKIKSVEIVPDKIQISAEVDKVILAERYLSSAVQIEILRKHHVYNSVVLAISRVLRAAHPIHAQAFTMRYIGVNYTNDTGDFRVLSIIEIAKRFARERSAVEKWIRRIRDDFTQELTARGLLKPEQDDIN